MKKLIRKGEVKEVYEVGKGSLEFVFTDNISVFNKIVPNEIPRKGESLCKTSSYWLEEIEKQGYKTHFQKRKDARLMEVKRYEVFEDHDKIDQDRTDYKIPLEFISRHFVTGSLYDRIKKGKIDHKELGFEEEPVYGDRLPKPFFEMINKSDEHDRRLSVDEALSVSGLNRDEFDEIKEVVFKIDELIQSKVENNDLLHVEGKKEFALDENRDPVIVDTFGTIDEDRWWVKSDYDDGNIVEMSKEFVIQHYKDIGYYDELMKAREKGGEEPPIPDLPEKIVDRTSDLYLDMMERLTDGKFR